MHNLKKPRTSGQRGQLHCWPRNSPPPLSLFALGTCWLSPYSNGCTKLPSCLKPSHGHKADVLCQTLPVPSLVTPSSPFLAAHLRSLSLSTFRGRLGRGPSATTGAVTRPGSSQNWALHANELLPRRAVSATLHEPQKMLQEDAPKVVFGGQLGG